MVARIKGKPLIDARLKDGDILWRYLDMARFFDLIHNKRLFFQRGDQLRDKFEGAFTESLKKAISAAYKGNDINFSYEEFKTKLRERVFVNCWHKSTDDSMAMWRIYGRSETSLAVTTTVEKLRDSLIAARIPHHLSVSKVCYIKHWRNPDIKANPYSNVFVYKVKAYEFEKEVRVIIDRFSEDFDSDPVEKGMHIPIRPNKLLRSIVISPESTPWFVELIEEITSKYETAIPVRRSKLAFDPI